MAEIRVAPRARSPQMEGEKTRFLFPRISLGQVEELRERRAEFGNDVVSMERCHF